MSNKNTFSQKQNDEFCDEFWRLKNDEFWVSVEKREVILFFDVF